jgi:uncharacterized Zn-binding protein involved in type VI secretion
MPEASRITDLHVCVVHPPVPLPIVAGATTVNIGFSPAARVGDQCACPANAKIAMGCPTVFIEHKMAARVGDPTVPPGVIRTGFPTVFIGASAQASALGAAAEAGIPFCEECSPSALAGPTGNSET